MRIGLCFIGFADASAKVRKILEFLKHLRLKYLVLVVIALVMTHAVLGSAVSRPVVEWATEQVRGGDSLAAQAAVTDTIKADTAKPAPQEPVRRSRRRAAARRSAEGVAVEAKNDTLAKPDSLAPSVLGTCIRLGQCDGHKEKTY